MSIVLYTPYLMSVYIRSIYHVRKHVIYARRVYVSLRRVDRTRKNPTIYRTARILRLLYYVKAY